MKPKCDIPSVCSASCDFSKSTHQPLNRVWTCLADCWFDDRPRDWNLWHVLLIQKHVGPCLFILLCVFALQTNTEPNRTHYCLLLLTKKDQTQNIISPTQLLLEASLNSDLWDWSNSSDFLQWWLPTVCRGLVSESDRSQIHISSLIWSPIGLSASPLYLSTVHFISSLHSPTFVKSRKIFPFQLLLDGLSPFMSGFSRFSVSLKAFFSISLKKYTESDIILGFDCWGPTYFQITNASLFSGVFLSDKS